MQLISPRIKLIPQEQLQVTNTTSKNILDSCFTSPLGILTELLIVRRSAEKSFIQNERLNYQFSKNVTFRFVSLYYSECDMGLKYVETLKLHYILYIPPVQSQSSPSLVVSEVLLSLSECMAMLRSSNAFFSASAKPHPPPEGRGPAFALLNDRVT